jgi:K+-transporting ATPase KdpF subunit
LRAVRAIPGKRTEMIENLVVGTLAIALIVYLFRVLVRPEDF